MTRNVFFLVFFLTTLIFVHAGGNVNIKHKSEAWKKKPHTFRRNRSRLVKQDLKEFRVIALRSHLPLIRETTQDGFSLPDYQLHPDNGHLYFTTHGNQFQFNITKSYVFSPDYVEYRQGYVNGTMVQQNVTTAFPPSHDCYYNGQQEINGTVNWIAVSTCSGTFKGMFQGGSTVYGVEPAVEHLTQDDITTLLNQHADATPGNLHVIYTLDDLVEPTGTCITTLTNRTNHPVTDPATGGHHDLLRNILKDTNLRFPGTHKGRHLLQTQLYNELLVVNDYQRYIMQGQNTETDSANIVNTVNTIYSNSQFTPVVQMVLVAQVTWSTGDPYKVSLGTCSSCAQNEVGVDELLSDFQNWRSGPNAPPHDNGHLFSGYKFQSTVLGYADVGSMCQQSSSGGVEQVWGPTARDGAVVSHEMGHNFGMQHDSTGNTCAQSGFIMNAVITTTPTLFSTCSHDYFNQFINTFSCLDNVPTSRWGTPVCGNGFVETGEQCDCGPPATCTDACCNAKTCMFAATAQCSPSDPCCNASCRIVTNTSQVCRPATGYCDVEETCDGINSFCPVDWFRGAGASCNLTTYDDMGECYLGQCESFKRQCVDDSAGLSSVPLTACDADEQASFNNGDFCATLFCLDPTSGSCVYLTVSGQTDSVHDGIPCDTGKQCLKSKCVSSDAMQPQFSWVAQPWSDCDTCEQPQTRTALCYFQDPTISPPPPPRLVNPEYCSAVTPSLTQLCDNVTLGCTDTSLFAANSINFFGVEMPKYALILAVLGVIALILVLLAGCYYAVTYQSGKMANPRVRKIGNSPYQHAPPPESPPPHGGRVQQAPKSPKNLFPPASPKFLGASPPISPNQRHQQQASYGGGGQQYVFQQQEWVDPNGEYAIEYA